ncbi:hypothetical protein [Acidocella facilis]|uniref:hypothetical protein n=1 Tax=Acidocella facilis TaxID=525 RepID=UPI001F16E959|nr:hypothetical protein [Acidocella facilis]
MILLGFVFSLLGIGFMCWLLFNLAVYALPCFLGIWAGIAAYHSGAGVVGTIIIALVAGVATALAGQLAVLAIPVTSIRAAIALLFAGPAAFAGYNTVLGIAEIGIPSHAWRVAFAVFGAVMVGGTAWARMSFAVPTIIGQTLAGESDQPPMASWTRGR